MTDTENYESKLLFKGMNILIDENPVFLECTPDQSSRSSLFSPFIISLLLTSIFGYLFIKLKGKALSMPKF